MSKTVAIWVYQETTWIRLQINAANLFGEIDSRFRPGVHLIGFDFTATDHPVCIIESDDDSWLTESAFEGLRAVLHSDLDEPETIREYVFDENLEQPDYLLEFHQTLHQNQRKLALLRRRVNEIVQDIASSSSPTQTYYVSEAVVINGYCVMAILGLQTDVVKGHYTLQKQDFGMESPSRSFIDSNISCFLDHAATMLRVQDPHTLLHFDTDEYLRKAASQFVNGLVIRTGSRAIDGRHNLYKNCDRIASERYEGDANKGAMTLVDIGNPAILPEIKFSSPIALRDSRAARKQFEMSSSDLSIYSDGDTLRGLSSLQPYDPETESMFTIQMSGHNHWELLHDGHRMLIVQNGIPRLPSTALNEDKLRRDLRRAFPTISEEEIVHLVNLADCVRAQRHGALLIISDHAEKEARRLTGVQGSVDPFRMTSTLIENVSSIDGAVVLSYDAMCYGIGVILDGKASANINPGRGSRYNSAIRYVDTTDKESITTFAIIVSEDRTVDVYPDWPDAIDRSIIDGIINELRTLKTRSKISPKELLSVLDPLEQFRFYLCDDDGAVINPLVHALAEQMEHVPGWSEFLLRKDYTVDKNFDKKRFYL